MSEPQAGTSAGALLRAAREKQGLHIAALAAAIKVSPRKLDALENDRWDELPDATFTRALAQTVCRTLKIDARPVLDLLPAAGNLTLEAGGSRLNAPFRDRPGRDEPGVAGTAIRPMIWAATVLMVAAVVVYLLPDGWLGSLGGSSAPAPAVVEVAPVPVEPASAVFAESASAPEMGASALLGAAPAASAAASAVAPPVVAPASPLPAAGVAAAVVPAVAAPAASAALNPNAIVQLRSSAASWVEVRDARGQLLLSRTVQPGESVGIDGALPIRLIIGNAGATQLGFRGQTIDLAPRTRDNVARVELQ